MELYQNYLENRAYRSHWRRVQDAIIHSETMNTSSTVPGQIVISVFKTNLRKCAEERVYRMQLLINGRYTLAP